VLIINRTSTIAQNIGLAVGIQRHYSAFMAIETLPPTAEGKDCCRATDFLIDPLDRMFDHPLA
jgi:hypothetical protein